MWPRIFLLLLAAGIITGALAITVITALKKRHRIRKLEGLGSLIISAIYGAAMIGAYVAALMSARLVISDLRSAEASFSEWRMS